MGASDFRKQRRASPVNFPQQLSPDNVYHHGKVIVIHGLSANTLVMRPIGYFLNRNGFESKQWGYHTNRQGVLDDARRLQDFLEPLSDDPQPLHFVTHSMGGVVLRAALANMTWNRPGRAVMLAPPNHGSKLAQRFSPGLKWLWPALADLSTLPDSLVNRLPPLQSIETGVIAGTRDILVDVDSTHMVNERDHILVRCGHNRMLIHGQAHREMVHFLRFGHFSPQARRAPVDSKMH